MRSASIERHTYAADPICAPGADSSPTSLIELKAQEAEVKATEAKAAEAKAACPSSAMSLAPRAHHPSILDSGRTDSGGGAPTGAEPLNGSRSASGDPLSRTGSSFRAQDGSDGQHCQTSFKNLRARPKPPQQCVLDSKYQLGEELGRGSSGKVYRALNRETGDFRAIKQIPACNMPIGHLEAVQSEIDLLHNLQHPQIVRYFETIRTEFGAFAAKLKTKLEQLQVPKETGREEDERVELLAQQEHKVATFAATHESVKVLLKDEAVTPDALVDAAGEALAEALDAEKGAGVTQHEIFDAHARRYEADEADCVLSDPSRDLRRACAPVRGLLRLVCVLCASGVRLECALSASRVPPP